MSSNDKEIKKEKKMPGTKVILKTYWQYVKKHPFLLTGVFVGSIGLQITGLASPLFLRQFFNQLASFSPSPDNVQLLLITLGLVGLMWVLDWVAYQIQRTSNEFLEAKVMSQLFNESFDYLMGHSHNFFTSNFAGSLAHKVSRFSRAFENLFDAIATQFFPAFLFVLGAIVVLFVHNHTLGVILGIWAVLFLLLQVYLSKARQPARQALSEASTKVTGELSDAISNQSTVTLFSARPVEYDRLSRTNSIWRKALLRSWTIDGWTQAILSLFMTAIQVILLYVAVLFWSKGQLTLGDFYLIQAYLLSTFNRLMGINYQLRGFYGSLSDAAEMVAILEEPHEVKDKKSAKQLRVDAGEVWFDDVSFNFQTGTDVLHQFNLTIAGGERVALVGPSGAGKSTVTKLLLRLYDVPQGEIKIDKQDISKVTQDSLRDAISFVPQEPILFHRSLMENIRYGYRDATDEQVTEAAKKAHCHEFISKLPLGYETFVGERGIKLSGGERQRVAIARAILKDAPILVLDEATSSLDSESEALIQDALNILMEGKTVVVIAHRLSTIMKMDRIVVMEGGQIVAQGTHLQLIKEKGLYQKLWSIQAGGFIGVDDEEQAPLEPAIEEDDDLAESPKEK